jgi:hypothetical protein
MRKILTTAALALAAAVTVVPTIQASAQATYHHRASPAAVTSYSCTRELVGFGRHHRRIYREDCKVQVLFTGPQGEWALHIWAPRHEELTGFEYGTTESSALGSWIMNRTIYTSYTQVGVPDDYEYTGGILPAGQTATGTFWFNVPAGEQIPRVTVQAATTPYPGSGPAPSPTPTPTTPTPTTTAPTVTS